MNRDFFMEALYTAIWVPIFYSFYTLLVLLVFDVRTDVLFTVAAVLFFTMFLIRRFIKSAVLMFLVHVVLICAAWFLSPNLHSLVVFFSMAILMTAFSMVQRYKRAQTFSPEFIIFTPLLLIILAIAMGTQGHTHMHIQYAAIIIFIFVAAKFHMRMDQFNLALGAITQSSNQPVKKILNFDYKVMLVMSVVIIGLIFFLHITFVRPALEAAVSLLPDDFAFNIEGGPPPELLPGGGPPDMGIHDMFYQDNRGPFILWVILEWIFIYIFMPALGLLAIYGAFRGIIYIFRLLGKGSSRGEKLTDGYEDEKEFISNPVSWFKRLLRRSPKNEHKIRRRFRETVVKQMKKGVPIECSDTPAQMAGKIHLEDFDSLADEYAQVRYK